jgi:hypothetical protein
MLSLSCLLLLFPGAFRPCTSFSDVYPRVILTTADRAGAFVLAGGCAMSDSADEECTLHVYGYIGIARKTIRYCLTMTWRAAAAISEPDEAVA